MESVYEINDEVKREVLSRVDLVALIGAVTTLKKLGSSWKGLCPFHSEKTPSFHVHPAKGFYYCFGCGAKGDAITFVRETERLEFVEAIAYLARQTGVSLPVRRATSRAARARTAASDDALSAAARFFRENLSKHGKACSFLASRGVALEESGALGFGAAPDGWDALHRALCAEFPEEALMAAGLLQKSPETGRVYDRFRNRLTIEIRDPRGEVVGFGARALDDADQPKYLNSPESSRFSKGKLLFGLDRAREAVRRAGSVFLVEGYFDQIAFSRAGLSNCVASMGTALTPAQADMLARQAPAVTVAYDGDAAGQAAFLKAAALLVERGVDVSHLGWEAGEDPDSCLAKSGPDGFRTAVARSAVPLLAALLRRVPPSGSSPTARAERIQEAAEILRQAPDRVLRHELLASLANGTDIPLGSLMQPGKKSLSKSVSAKGDDGEARLPESEKKVLAVLLSEWPRSVPLVERIPTDLFSHPKAREILLLLQGKRNESRALDFSELASHLEGSAGQAVLRLLFEEPQLQGTPRNEPGETGWAGLHKSLLRLKILRLEERSSALQPEIASVERTGDTERREELELEKKELATRVRELKSKLKQEIRQQERQRPEEVD